MSTFSTSAYSGWNPLSADKFNVTSDGVVYVTPLVDVGDTDINVIYEAKTKTDYKKDRGLEDGKQVSGAGADAIISRKVVDFDNMVAAKMRADAMVATSAPTPSSTSSSSPSSSSTGGGKSDADDGSGGDGGGEKTPFYKEPWFWAASVGGTALLGYIGYTVYKARK